MANNSEVVLKVKAIMAEESGPLSKFLLCKEVLLNAKVGYFSILDVDTMLVHPANRGGLGINHFNAHQTGFKIHKVGADLSQLKQACCVEMHPVGVAKELEVACNQKLVAKSAGMLAPVTGQERYVSLSCGHTAAFCKAAKARCNTNIPGIADAAGKLDPNLLASTSPNFAKMLGEGWLWFVVPYWLADEVPGFPHLAQQALNASHSVANQATEMEVAASIAEEVASQGSTICWKAAIAAAAASEPPCIDYIDTVGLYVKLYGGGSKAQLIHFLSGFAKQYGESLKLGQEFMKAITELQMPSQKSVFVHLRTAVVAAQLTTTKVVDGIARLITKADVNSFKTKPMQAQVEQVETLLDNAWKELQELLAAEVASDEQASKLYGLLCIRFVLFLTKKAKWGIDTTEWASLEAIFQAYKAEKDKVVSNCSSTASVAPRHSPMASSSSAAPATIGDASNPLWVAQQRMTVPMVVGNFFVSTKDHPNQVFQLTGLDIEGATFMEHNVLKPANQLQPVVCKLEELKKWLEFKGKLQKLIVELPATSSTHHQLELDKCQVFSDLAQLAVEHQLVPGDLMFAINPMELAAGRDFKKGELKLVPLTDSVARIVNTFSSRGSAVGLGGAAVLWIQPPPLTKLDELSTAAVGAPFWWVKPTSEPEAATLVVCKVHVGANSYESYTNLKGIKKFAKLMVLKPDIAVQPLKKAKTSR
jgi:hypothetical protein